VSSSLAFVVMSKELTQPSESLVQQLLAERRELKVTVERMRLELTEVQTKSGGPDPRVRELQAEIERLRYQLASARAEAGLMREERDELRAGIEHAVAQISDL
jgi:chromosome segregation ATPase